MVHVKIKKQTKALRLQAHHDEINRPTPQVIIALSSAFECVVYGSLSLSRRTIGLLVFHRRCTWGGYVKAFQGQPKLQDRPVILVAGVVSTYRCSDFCCR